MDRQERGVAMKHDILSLAREVVRTEAQAVAALESRLGESFQKAVELLADCRGKTIVAGVGKSGTITAPRPVGRPRRPGAVAAAPRRRA